MPQENGRGAGRASSLSTITIPGTGTQGLALRERSRKKWTQILPQVPQLSRDCSRTQAGSSHLGKHFADCDGRKLLQLPAAGKCLFLLFFYIFTTNAATWVKRQREELLNSWKKRAAIRTFGLHFIEIHQCSSSENLRLFYPSVQFWPQVSHLKAHVFLLWKCSAKPAWKAVMPLERSLHWSVLSAKQHWGVCVCLHRCGCYSEDTTGISLPVRDQTAQKKGRQALWIITCCCAV